FYDLFGVASFLIPYLLFAWGINITFKERLFKLTRIAFNSIFWILFLSTLATFIFPDSGFPFGGGLGNNNYDWLSTFIGRLGLGILLGIIGFSTLGFNLKESYLKLQQWKAQWEEQRKMAAAARQQEADSELDEFYREEELKADEGYEMESIIPEDTTPPTPHFEDPTFELTDTGATAAIPAAPATILPPLPHEEEAPFTMELIEKPVEETPEEIHQELELAPVILAAPTTGKKEKFSIEPDFEIEEIQAFGSIDVSEIQDPVAPAHFGLDTQYDPRLELSNYKFPSVDLLEEHGSGQIEINKEELEQHKNQIVQTLSHYNIGIEKIKATVGPTVTLYEIVPEKGVRISKIKNLEDDIALSLAALGIRIIAPIPGRGTIGIEVPNIKKSIVSMRSLIASERFQKADMELPIALGKTISNEDFVVDLAKMPHLLMAGATGQGKSVGLNA
ncbi:MAG TPA: DNA translocase FtsK 4TM domain-containing protein, partial [Chitinophagales bacterium]|nr:DNA translocase FtsK 4TM domain-containing protein [Chitinophagales bacterium]